MGPYWLVYEHIFHIFVMVAFSQRGENIGIAIDIESKHQTLPLTLALIKHLKKNWHWHCHWKAFQEKHWHWHWHWKWCLQKHCHWHWLPNFAIAHVWCCYYVDENMHQVCIVFHVSKHSTKSTHGKDVLLSSYMYMAYRIFVQGKLHHDDHQRWAIPKFLPNTNT